LCAAFVALCLYFFNRYSTLSTVEHYMQQTPGLAITDAYWDGGQVVIEGLRDPDAVLPFTVLGAQGISENDIKMQTIPFRSLEYQMEFQRFKREFELPQGVQFGDGNGVVTLSGEAPLLWLQENELRLRQLSSDHRLDISALFASFDSILELVRDELSVKAAENIDSAMVTMIDRTTVKLSGRFNQALPAELDLLFLNNYWVDVDNTLK